MNQITANQKRKIRQFAQQILKDGPIESHWLFIKPRLILTKDKQLYTIIIIRCYHQSMLLSVGFLKAKTLEKADFIFKKM